jgi:hypothetical protein
MWRQAYKLCARHLQALYKCSCCHHSFELHVPYLEVSIVTSAEGSLVIRYCTGRRLLHSLQPFPHDLCINLSMHPISSTPLLIPITSVLLLMHAFPHPHLFLLPTVSQRQWPVICCCPCCIWTMWWSTHTSAPLAKKCSNCSTVSQRYVRYYMMRYTYTAETSSFLPLLTVLLWRLAC